MVRRILRANGFRSTAIAAFAGKGKIISAVHDNFWGHACNRRSSALHNAARFTMGIMDLQSGIYFVTLVMGLFALPEALFLVLDERRSKAMANNNKIENLRITKDEFNRAPVVGRQSLLGFFVGD